MRNICKLYVLAALIMVGSLHAAAQQPMKQAGKPTGNLNLREGLQNRDNSAPTVTSISGTTVSLLGAALWTHMNDVAVVGNYAYCVMNEGLMIMDITTPFSPIIVKYVLLPGRADAVNAGYTSDGGIAISGDFAYVSGGKAGMYVVNITVPGAASVVGHCSTRLIARDLAVTGNVACVADADSGLQIIDISTPSSPTLVGTYRGYAYAVAASGNYAYLSQYYGGMKIIDISVPASPTVVGSYSSSLYGLTVSGTYAYLARGTLLEVVDVSNPALPSFTSSIPLPSTAWDVAVAGGYAYLAGGSSTPSLMIIDVSNPLAPATKGTWDVYSHGGGVYHLAVSGNQAFVPEQRYGLNIVNVANANSPFPVGYCNTPSRLLSVTLSGNYAYVSTDYTGFWTVDVTIPASPIAMSQFSNNAYDAVVSGNYAYLTTYFGLQTVRISNPSSPFLMSTYVGGSGSGARVAISGNYVYYAQQILNVTNPSAPVLTGSHVYGLVTAVAGTHAYACAGSAGINIIDVSNPASPILAGNYNTPGTAFDVVVSGNLAYVADSNSLQIINITNPSSPTFVGSYTTAAIASRVSISGNLVYISEGAKGIQMINVVNPASPSLAAAYDSPSLAEATAASGSDVFLADFDGLLVLNVTQPCCTATTTGDVDASGSIDIADLTAMVDYIFSSVPFPGTCFLEQDVDKSGSIDITDLQGIIDYLFSGAALLNCP
jgi:hypothetical protein